VGRGRAGLGAVRFAVARPGLVG